MGQSFVYLYRSSSGKPKYVGFGGHSERAMEHVGASHNPQLRAWLAKGDYDLSIAGPYRDEIEGRRVEAALISALQPEFNVAPGDGPKFVPLGVPPELGERPTLPPLTAADLGVITGGALLVYLAPGDYLSDGREKFDPAHPDDHVVVSNIEGVWDLGRHLPDWRADPESGPQVLIGIHGKKVTHRFVVGAARIDTTRWGATDLEVPDRNRWRVPLVTPIDLDACGLRGRRVEQIKFGQFSWLLHQWIDAIGTRRHPQPA